MATRRNEVESGADAARLRAEGREPGRKAEGGPELLDVGACSSAVARVNLSRLMAGGL